MKKKNEETKNIKAEKKERNVCLRPGQLFGMHHGKVGLDRDAKSLSRKDHSKYFEENVDKAIWKKSEQRKKKEKKSGIVTKTSKKSR